MRQIISIILFFIISHSYSQDGLKTQIELIEKTIKSNSMSNFQKLEVDLDNDNDLDYIYLYQCAEPKCVEVYLNVNCRLPLFRTP